MLQLQCNVSKFSFNAGNDVNLLLLQFNIFKVSFNGGKDVNLLWLQYNCSNFVNLDRSGITLSCLFDISIQVVSSGKESMANWKNHWNMS